MKTINPTTGKLIKTYPEHSYSSVDKICQQSQKTFEAWRYVSFKERGAKMKKAAKILLDNKKTYALLMAEEMGKPLKQGLGEIEKCAWTCEFYSKEAERYLAPQMIKTEASKSYIAYEPLGIILAIMPWNFPFWQVFRCAAPTLMAGNVILLKHAESVSGCAVEIEDIFKKAGFPSGSFRSIFVKNEHMIKVIEHPLVQAVTLTGSTRAGKSVAAAAGSVVKKTVLELGGSDPYIILEDADLVKAVETCVASRLINGGQSCVSAKRFLVVESLYEEFTKRFVAKMSAQSMGSPLNDGVTLGPLARHDLRDQLHNQVTRSVKQGAKLLLGGKIPDSPGAFYPPTVLTNVCKGMAAYEEELFGPVAVIIKVKNAKEALYIANDTEFGLGAAIFSKNKKRAEQLAVKELQAGCCFVNESVKSDPRLPFGGTKQSGYGRELSELGIHEFVNIKTVYIK